MTAKEQHCPSCGYTEEDAKLHMDHSRCKNAGNAPWEKRRQNAAESLPADWRGFVESLREVPPVEAKEKEPETAKIPCYEVYDAKDIDCTVFQHERMKDLQEFVYQLLDGLEDGESIRIEFKNYTQEELDEVYDEL